MKYVSGMAFLSYSPIFGYSGEDAKGIDPPTVQSCTFYNQSTGYTSLGKYGPLHVSKSQAE